MSAAPDASSAWAVRRMRAEMLQTLPDLPDALCRKQGFPDMWHPERTTRKQESEAQKICMACPEMLRCLGYAIRAHPVSGIWGGTTESQRKVLIEAVATRTSLMD